MASTTEELSAEEWNEALEKAYPLIFSTEMMVSLNEDLKTVTRRVVRRQPIWETNSLPRLVNSKEGVLEFIDLNNDYFTCEYGVPGSYLWVREAFRYQSIYEMAGGSYRSVIKFRADGKEYRKGFWTDHREAPEPALPGHDERWRPSIHMPRWVCRQLLKIKSIKLQRVQDITAEDVVKEGVKFPAVSRPNGIKLLIPLTGERSIIEYLLKGREHKGRDLNFTDEEVIIANFASLWDRLNKKRGFSWESNPFVWRIEFEKVSHG